MALPGRFVRYQWTPVRRSRSAVAPHCCSRDPSLAAVRGRLHVSAGERVCGWPLGPTGPRFLCDEMLARLARYLRAAGYDTRLAGGGAPDGHWIALARAEGRILLTCDRRLLEHKAARGVALRLPQGQLEVQALHLTRHCGVDWLWRPFTRCLVDNRELEPADASALRLPLRLQARNLRRCPGCGRVFWAGSHHRRMRERLACWSARAGTAEQG